MAGTSGRFGGGRRGRTTLGRLAASLSAGSSLTGHQDAFHVVNVKAGVYNFTGTDASTIQSHNALSANAGSYAITGTNATLTYAGVGGGFLITGETDALGIDFTYATNTAMQMQVITSSAAVNSSPYSSLTYTSPSIKMCRQSDGIWRYGSHNLYLNSAVPADQAVTVVASGTYSVVITGSVSITVSGAATGTYTSGTNNFTAATTTLTCGSTTGSGTVTVYRTPCVGTYLATTGAIKIDLPYEWNVSNVAQGILIEEARTNLALRSQEFDNANWTADDLTVSANATTAPDGTSTADKLVSNTNNSGRSIGKASLNISANTTYTTSVFVKAAGYNYVYLEVDATDFAKGYYSFFNLSNGTVGSTQGTYGSGSTFTSATISDAGNGWYRCTLTGILDNALTASTFLIGVAQSDTLTTAAGDGSSGLYVWGAQYEAGAFATSAIHTIGATVTRAVDTLSLATSGFPVDATKGTLYAKFNPINVGAIRYALAQDDDTANEHHSIGSSAAGAGQFNVVDGGAAQTGPLTNGTVTAGAVNRVAASWKVNDFAISTNGTAASTDTSGSLPTVTKLKLGVGNTSTSVLNGYLQHVVSLPRDMTDAELVTRST